jgi:hypothetical protein
MPEDAVSRLLAAGLLRCEQSELRTTRRFQSAMVRAAGRVYQSEVAFDLRVPIALALIELFGADTDTEELSALVDAMLPIESRELERLTTPKRAEALGAPHR